MKMHVLAILYDPCMYKKNIQEETLRSHKVKSTYKLKAQRVISFQNKSWAIQIIFKNLSLNYEVDLGLVRIYMNNNISREA